MQAITLPSFIQNPDPNIYLSDNYLVVDIETTNNKKGDAVDGQNRVVYGYCVGSDGSTISLCEDPRGTEKLIKKLEEVDFVIFHGGKFELKWFFRWGIEINKFLIYDTLLGEYVLAGNRKWALDLDSVAKRYGGRGKASLISTMMEAGICPSEMPYELLKDYCKQDVYETLNIFFKQRQILKEKGLLPVLFLRCITTPVLANIEMNGIFLDKEMVQKVHKEFIDRYNEVRVILDEITGGINMASPTQVAQFMYSKLGLEELKDKQGNPIRNKPSKQFPHGIPLTDEHTIAVLKPKTALQRKFIELKKEESKLRKKITSYSERFVEACKNSGSIMYGKLNQSISQTHRLTSTDPNLQNIDRKLKKVITARHPGWKIRSADYKTLEMTTAGQIAQDPQVLLDLKNRHDFHIFTARELLGKQEITHDERQDAKPDTFGPLYNKQNGTKEQKRYYEAFRKRYQKTYETQQGWVTEVLKTKQLRTVTGLIFYWPDTEYVAGGYIRNSTNIFNYPIQMFATADIAPTGVCLLWHYMKALGLKSFIINEVHDSVVIEENPEDAGLMGNLVEKALSKDIVEFLEKVLNYKINFPLEVEQKLSTHWDWNKSEKK